MDRTRHLATISRLAPVPPVEQPLPPRVATMSIPPNVARLAHTVGAEAGRVSGSLSGAFCTPQTLGSVFAALDRLLSVAAELKAAAQRIGE